MSQKKLVSIVFLLGYLAWSVLFPPDPPKKQVKPVEILHNAASSSASFVVRVVDGDTIEIEGGQKVRYIGINSPESVDPRRPVACFGKEAHAENVKLVEGKMVRLEKDVSDMDKYGRLLRYVYVGDVFINDYLVRQGFASASTYPPDVLFAETFKKAQSEAQTNNRGLWKTCQ